MDGTAGRRKQGWGFEGDVPPRCAALVGREAATHQDLDVLQDDRRHAGKRAGVRGERARAAKGAAVRSCQGVQRQAACGALRAKRRGRAVRVLAPRHVAWEAVGCASRKGALEAGRL